MGALAASTVRGERHFNVETLDQSRRVVDVKVITCPGLDVEVVSTHGDIGQVFDAIQLQKPHRHVNIEYSLVQTNA